MRRSIALLVLLSTLLAPALALGLPCTSVGSGGWSAPATWGGCGGGVPGVGDTATINVGHVVYVDGNITVGMAPLDTVTYDLDISGTLTWPGFGLAASWTFTARSSVRVNAGGSLIIGGAFPIPAAQTASFILDTAASNQYYTIYLNGGTFWVEGYPYYNNTAGTVVRARIASCAPACTAGAGRTLTLDRDVNWGAVGAPSNFHKILVGIGGNEATSPAAADDSEQISVWTAPAANQIGGVTLVENHLPGDTVVSVFRNVYFSATSATYQPKVYTTAVTNDPYDLNWVTFDEFGYSNSANNAALNAFANTKTLGTWDHVAVLDANRNNANSCCFYISSAGWTKLEGLVCDDVYGGYGYMFESVTPGRTVDTLTDLNFFGGSAANHGYAMVCNSWNRTLAIGGFWGSNLAQGLLVYNTRAFISDTLLHGVVGATGAAIQFINPAQYKLSVRSTLSDSEIRNSLGSGIYGYYPAGFVLSNVDFDNIGRSALWVASAPSDDLRLYNCTFDYCNSGGTGSYAPIHLDNPSGSFYGVGVEFGVRAANVKHNIMWSPAYSPSTAPGRFRGTCNECIFTPPAAPSWALSEIYLFNGVAGYAYTTFISHDSFFTIHNKNGVAGTHEGWGPGGMYFWREPAVVVDSTLAVGMHPGSAMDYEYLPIGDVYVTAGTTLTVDVQLRKDETVPAGDRPLLALDGGGFIREINQDVMSDAINTWETQTVSGVVAATGVVHLYIGVKGKLSGANDYQPVWPPTLTVYADGLVVTKT